MKKRKEKKNKPSIFPRKAEMETRPTKMEEAEKPSLSGRGAKRGREDRARKGKDWNGKLLSREYHWNILRSKSDNLEFPGWPIHWRN